jgi:hypothetical protein
MRRRVFAAATGTLLTAVVGAVSSTGDATAAAAKVKVHPISLSVQTELVGESGRWRHDVAVRPNQQAKILLSYANTSTAAQRGVKVRVQLPRGSRVVPETTSLRNALHPTGWAVNPTLLIHQGKGFGDYAPQTNGYVTLTLQAPGTGLTCGRNIISVRGIITVPHVGTAMSTARLDVVRYCPTTSTTTAPPA